MGRYTGSGAGGSGCGVPEGYDEPWTGQTHPGRVPGGRRSWSTEKSRGGVRVCGGTTVVVTAREGVREGVGTGGLGVQEGRRRVPGVVTGTRGHGEGETRPCPCEGPLRLRDCGVGRPTIVF